MNASSEFAVRGNRQATDTATPRLAGRCAEPAAHLQLPAQGACAPVMRPCQGATELWLA